VFHGVEELRKADDGHLYWRGVCVEHYSYADGDEDREREAAHELAARCRKVEARGQPVSWSAVSEVDRWAGVGASLAAKVAAVAIVERYDIDGICDAPYIANVIHAEQTAADPYFISRGYVLHHDPNDTRPCSIPKGLLVDELRSVDRRPWSGTCATTGATMRDFADALAAVDVPAWAKRAAVSLSRSYASSFDWRTEVATVATIIRDLFGVFGAPTEGRAP
jgi:hypothetical protein